VKPPRTAPATQEVGAPRGYPDASAHLDDVGARLVLLLKHYVLRHWRRLVDSSGTLSDLFVSVHEALHALGVSAESLGETPEAWSSGVVGERLAKIERDLASWDAHLEHRLEASAGTPLPLEDLRALFRLDDAAVDVVVALARMQSDLDFSRLCTFAWADFSRKQPDVAFLADLLSVPAARRPAVLAALGPGGVLARRRLLTFHDPGEWVPQTPHFFQRVALPQRVVDFLAQGAAGLRIASSTGAAITTGQDLDALRFEDSVKRAALERWERARTTANPWSALLLWGPVGVGRTTLAAAIAAREGRPALVVDLRHRFELPADALEQQLVGHLQEAMLLDAVPVVELDLGPPDPSGHLGRHAVEALRRALDTWTGRVAFTASQPLAWLHSLGPVDALHVPFTTAADQGRAWEAALTAAGVVDPAAMAREYSARFNLPAGHIHQAIREAASASRGPRGLGRGDGPAALDDAAIRGAIRRLTSHRLGELASPVHTQLAWADLVAPDATLAGLREVRRTMAHRERVYDDWGFARIAAGQRGVRVLFSGPPGTGKTLAASILGRELARDVYRIDLSRVVDKYIGETEKNLGRIFDEAEHAQVLLLFDEADSLFAGRTTVQSSHDRHANVQTNFLLQRIETFEGVCVLTTNYEENIDEAFKRRLHGVIRFPAPDAASRALLWRSMIPEQARAEADLGIEALARDFEFAGGHIRNCALRAAFAAADEGAAISKQHLRDAAIAEARQLGLAVRELAPPPRRHGPGSTQG
jgi:AAA+ superfamily predicted ATPase